MIAEFFALVLAAQSGTEPSPRPLIPPADRVLCPSQRIDRGNVSPYSDEMLRQDYPAVDPEQDPFFAHRAKASATQASDLIRFPVWPATWFQGHVGAGGNGENIAYDPAAHVLYRCAYANANQFIEARLVDVAPPSYVPRVRVQQFASSSGLAMGSSATAVDQVYGVASPLQLDNGLSLVTYEKDTPLPHGNLPYVTTTSFLIRDGRVVGIQRLSGI